MTSTPHELPSREQRNEARAAYLDAVDQGENPDPKTLGGPIGLMADSQPESGIMGGHQLRDAVG